MPDQKTIIVTGNARGGTTMAAGVLRILGVYMGDVLSANNNQEDQEFATVWHDKTQMRPLIEKRNTEHNVWGVKLPQFVGILEKMHDLTRNGHFILVFRDPVAVSMSVNGVIDQSYYDRIGQNLTVYEEMADFATRSFRTIRPCLALSYEKSLIDPSEAVTKIADFVGVVPKPNQAKVAAEYIKPNAGGYEDISTYLTRAK